MNLLSVELVSKSVESPVLPEIDNPELIRISGLRAEAAGMMQEILPPVKQPQSKWQRLFRAMVPTTVTSTKVDFRSCDIGQQTRIWLERGTSPTSDRVWLNRQLLETENTKKIDRQPQILAHTTSGDISFSWGAVKPEEQERPIDLEQPAAEVGNLLGMLALIHDASQRKA